MRAVVFAYSNVGDRCLRVLKAQGVDVTLVITNSDSPSETLWFDRVEDTAAELGLSTIVSDDPADPRIAVRIAEARPDIVFSFYYRAMIPVGLFASATLGAFNMHGSMLPKYRGRSPTNWAVLKGETETGATLHEMLARPDAGSIVDQLAVPILPDDTAQQVFGKVTVAAEQILWRSLPLLATGNAPRLPNDIAEGSYFSGRKPDDGRIDWSNPARVVYNLIRAVAPPYPGAFDVIGGKRVVIGKARLFPYDSRLDVNRAAPGFHVIGDRIVAVCGDANLIDVRQIQVDGAPKDALFLSSLLNARPAPATE